MTGVELVAAALAAGAAAGLTGAVDDTVREAAGKLRELLRSRFSGRSSAQNAIDAAADDGGAGDALESEPERWRELIGADLTATGADVDPEVLAAARRLLELTGASAGAGGGDAGKYRVDLQGCTGVVVGDGSTMNITIN